MSRTPSPPFSVLPVDDEPSFLRSMGIFLERSLGITNILRCDDSRRVMEILAERTVGLVLLDLNMPHIPGEELLRAIIQEHPQVGVIIVSGINQIETAVQCMRSGALDYLVKTADQETILAGIQRAVRMIELQRENLEMKKHLLSGSLEHPEAFGEIVTRSAAMHSIFQYLESVAFSHMPILVTGDSGVGKELIARAVHAIGRPGEPMVALNVAGLDDAVFADTLFGHKPGAFTGAGSARTGLIEEAGGGTLFLDEIGDLSALSQVKLLRLLQDGEYYPLGSDRPKRMKARIIAATHNDLADRQRRGTFRKDLFYRLWTHHVHIPSLRERKEDIPLLLAHFVAEACRAMNKKIPTMPGELPVLLSNYPFPGNVRELKSMVWDAVRVHKSRMPSMAIFRLATGGGLPAPVPEPPGERDGDLPGVFIPGQPLPSVHDVVDLLVREAMARSGNNQSIACRLIGISQPALSKRLKKMGRPPEPL